MQIYTKFKLRGKIHKPSEQAYNSRLSRWFLHPENVIA